jgi:hypothetical protein
VSAQKVGGIGKRSTRKNYQAYDRVESCLTLDLKTTKIGVKPVKTEVPIKQEMDEDGCERNLVAVI